MTVFASPNCPLVDHQVRSDSTADLVSAIVHCVLLGGSLHGHLTASFSMFFLSLLVDVEKQR